MKKIVLALCIVFSCMISMAQQQEYHIRVHKSTSILFEKSLSDIDSIVAVYGEVFIYYNGLGNDYAYYFSKGEVDSISFPLVEIDTSSKVQIVYSGNGATVVNPFEQNGVSVSVSGANVTVNSTSDQDGVEYVLSGATTNGCFNLTSSKCATVVLNGVDINKNGNAPMTLSCSQGITIMNEGTESSLSDTDTGANGAAIQCTGPLVFGGTGQLSLTSAVGHAIKSTDKVRIIGGDIEVLSAVKDGIHSSEFNMNGGSLIINNVGDDGIDCSSNIVVYNGSIVINCTTDDTKCISSDGNITIEGGNIEINNAGDMSKGIKCDGLLSVSGGTITSIASGNTVMETVSGVNDPAFCTAIKADNNINISGGTIDITLPSTNNGGKGLTSESNISITGGVITISTAGDGAVYYVGSTKESYSSSCIKCDGNINLEAGEITCTSSGSAGKGIVCDGTMTIGELGASNDNLNLTVTTSGIHLLVLSSGWDNSDYANAKAIKSEGNMTINSGIININCTQTTEGGECLESKATITINGGEISTISAYDDGINAGTSFVMNGGRVFSKSGHNDGIDSNGTMTINGGMIVSNGSSAPEEGLDCDNNTFTITGGIVIGTGGATSNPTQSTCTQRSLKISTKSNYAIQILDSNGNEVMTYQCPVLNGGGGGPGGGPGGGGGTSGLILLFSDNLSTGTYTIKYNGTISGGTNWNGYYTGATYTGGSSRTFTISSMLTSVNGY